MTPIEVVKNWLLQVQKPRKELNGKSVCPFARMPNIVVVEKLSIDNVKPAAHALTIYVEDSINSSFDDINSICMQLKATHDSCVFLPDHPQKKNYINGVETGNGHLPLIIVQNKKELLGARRSLEKTDYYDKWDKDYLDEIKSYGD